jgi:hypothetical protein
MRTITTFAALASAVALASLMPSVGLAGNPVKPDDRPEARGPGAVAISTSSTPVSGETPSDKVPSSSSLANGAAPPLGEGAADKSRSFVAAAGGVVRPDDRATPRGAGAQVAATQSAGTPAASAGGFDWGNAAVGALGGAALILLLGGGVVLLLARRGNDSRVALR